MRATRPLAALALTIAALVSPAAAAAPSPVPPCGAETVPAYPDVGEPPAVQVWFGDDDGADWTPPGCTQWQEGGFTAMIGMAARFRHEGGLEALLARVGGISDSKRIRYWSVTRKRLARPRRGGVRAFLGGPRRTAPGLLGRRVGTRQRLPFPARAQQPHRRRGLSHGNRGARRDRAVLSVENSSPIRLFRIPVVGPGEQQLVVFLDRESEDVWRFYSLMRSDAGFTWQVRQRMPSYVNRAVAEYRHLAGIPTDHEPPAIP